MTVHVLIKKNTFFEVVERGPKEGLNRSYSDSNLGSSESVSGSAWGFFDRGSGRSIDRSSRNPHMVAGSEGEDSSEDLIALRSQARGSGGHNEEVSTKRQIFEAHLAGTCNPCHWFTSRASCRRGDACTFCHYDHPKKERQKERSRPRKVRRNQCRKEAEELSQIILTSTDEFLARVKALLKQGSYMQLVARSTLRSMQTKMGDDPRLAAAIAEALTYECDPNDNGEDSGMDGQSDVTQDTAQTARSIRGQSSATADPRLRPQDQYQQGRGGGGGNNTNDRGSFVPNNAPPLGPVGSVPARVQPAGPPKERSKLSLSTLISL
eukprot:TRINITY_DN57179_c0_g1_i1.p1 TRINITY_DN57179_c0_g1~~TRINITY_DN57179_c0_g1_i1.p1  ORF type:complete len:333 (-),score=45.31 TRINITY_DN57179_c0_g1_i1:186-1151(-)